MQFDINAHSADNCPHIMTHKNLIILAVLLAVASGQEGSFADYDYPEPLGQSQSRPLPPLRPPSRPSSSSIRGFGPAGPTSPRPTPVPILKQINRHNDDGSYTYGYEAADGSFKIETKHVSGEVMGKYGYVDDQGKLRVVEYGANRFGFQPAGDGITVPPPTFVDETTRKGPNGEVIEEFDDGFYEPQPAPRPVSRPKKVRPQQSRPAPPATPRFEHNYIEPAPTPVHRAPTSHTAAGPVPPRAVVSGAIPSGPAEPLFQAQPQPYRPRPAPVRQNFAHSGGVLDELEQQYALPRGAGTPLHDITFGSYSSQTSF